MDYKQKYFKYKQKYLNLLREQKGGEPFLIDISAKPAYLWLFNKNQRQLELIFTRRQITFTMPLETITLNPKHRLDLLTKGSLSVVLVSRLVGLERSMSLVKKRILSRLHVLPPISPPTCIATMRRHTEGVTSLAFHPTQPLLASSSYDNTVKLWDCANPQNPFIRDLQPGHIDSVISVAFHPTQLLLASGSTDRTVKLWDCANPRNPTQIANLSGHTHWVSSVAFHPTLPYLASASYDHDIILWDCTNPRNPTKIPNLKGHTSAVTSVAFHPTLPLLASSSTDRTVKLWDCANPYNL
jgi:WD40 repeat protein